MNADIMIENVRLSVDDSHKSGLIAFEIRDENFDLDP